MSKEPGAVHQNIRRYLVAFAVAVFAWWGYTNYLQSRVVRVAVTAGDFAVLSAQVEKNNARDIVFVETPGSPANLEAVRVGEVDMAVAQAGIPLPDDLSILGIVRREHVLYFEREPRTDADVPPVVMTFREGQGSHVLGATFFEQWGYQNVRWLHSWDEVTTNPDYELPSGVKAIFVVVDPADPQQREGIRRATDLGFKLRDPDIGVAATHHPYLSRVEVQKGYYSVSAPLVPDSDVRTYAVENYLVAGPSMTDRRFLPPRHLYLHEEERRITTLEAPVVSDLRSRTIVGSRAAGLR